MSSPENTKDICCDQCEKHLVPNDPSELGHDPKIINPFTGAIEGLVCFNCNEDNAQRQYEAFYG